MKAGWRLVPAPMPINPVTVWEHTPASPYQGEYPRFIRPVRNECRMEWALVREDGVELCRRSM